MRAGSYDPKSVSRPQVAAVTALELLETLPRSCPDSARALLSILHTSLAVFVRSFTPAHGDAQAPPREPTSLASAGTRPRRRRRARSAVTTTRVNGPMEAARARRLHPDQPRRRRARAPRHVRAPARGGVRREAAPRRQSLQSSWGGPRRAAVSDDAASGARPRRRWDALEAEARARARRAPPARARARETRRRRHGDSEPPTGARGRQRQHRRRCCHLPRRRRARRRRVPRHSTPWWAFGDGEWRAVDGAPPLRRGGRGPPRAQPHRTTFCRPVQTTRPLPARARGRAVARAAIGVPARCDADVIALQEATPRFVVRVGGGA